MYVGHYAPALLARAVFPETRLGSLFVAAQALDFLFDGLALLGVERVTVAPGVRGPLAMQLEWMPFSHSLVAAGVLGGVVCAAGWAAGRAREGAALGAVVASHWVLDLVVHRPDLHLGLGATPRLGLGLWERPAVALALELALVVAAASLAAPKVARPRRLWAVVGAMVLAQVVVASAPAVGPATAFLVAAPLSYVGWTVAAARAEA